MADDSELHALNAVLRVAARHPNILEAESFAELTATVAAVIPHDRLTVLVPDGPLSLRIYALSPVGDDLLPFGARVPGSEATWRDLFDEQRPHFAEDLEHGTETERIAARAGVGSYGAFPMRVPVAPRGSAATRVIGLLTFSFRSADGARALPAALAQSIADAIGPSVERALQLWRAQRLAMILETSADAMLAWDRAGLVTDANCAAAALTGRSRAELIGTPIADLLDPVPAPGDPTHTADGVRLSLLARSDGETHGETRRVPVAATVTAVLDDALVAAHALLRDLTQVVRAEEVAAAARARLVQTDRLSTLGTLAAGVAHEINNPAAFILLGLDMLGRMLSGPGVQMDDSIAESAGETLRELRESIRRIVDIARDLRLFASPPAASGAPRTIIDVNRTVESALSLTRGQILERAQIERRLEEVPPVMMDDGRLGQVLVNLLVNAVHAIPKTYAGDQRITVATRSDGRTVEIEVTDTGVGIAPENLPRIWQPFFTTKGPDAGAGLGLSISRDIVERAGGTITVESPVLGAPEPGGTRFVITLPAAGQDDAAIQHASPLPEGGHSARVLIVEDEPALCRALAEEIGRCHEVEVASGGEQALALLAEQRFDVVLCDLRMPDMSGEALYARVLEQDEAQAGVFVFMTGVGFGAEVERFIDASGRPLLEKPFPADAALDAIARVVKRKRFG